MNRPTNLNFHLHHWQCSELLNSDIYDQIRQSMMLEGFKWDAQVADVCTLAPFALILSTHIWNQLARFAELLTQEALQAEAELQQRPDLWKHFGLPQAVQQAMAQTAAWTPSAVRVLRFDFHPTPQGWQISEANSDVPGGYTEASNFCKLMAEQIPGTVPVGHPARVLADALANQVPFGGRIAFLSAPGYLEDQQITTYLSHLLRQRGCITLLVHPGQVQWQDGIAHVQGQPVDAIFRFYQGEWLVRVRDQNWSPFFRGGKTPVCNPGSALFVESKRFPLVWDKLTTSLPTWKALLPPSCHPYEVNWLNNRRWLLKTAYCNTGDTVTMRGVANRRTYLKAVSSALLFPRDWVAQECFETLAIATPLGQMYPCLGVYTINGTATGIYGRIASQPIINFTALDVAVLIPK